MQVKTFRGRTLEDCFTQVKAQMGREAVILQSRAYQPIFGKFGPAMHEVIAALEINIADPPLPPARPNQLPPASPTPPRAEAAAPPAAPKPAPRPVYGYSAGSDSALRRPAPKPEPLEEEKILTEPEQKTNTIENLLYDRRLERLEQQINALTTNMTRLTEAALARKRKGEAPAAGPRPVDFAAEAEPLTPHAHLAKRLSESEVAAPLVRQLLEDLAPNLSDQAAAAEVRTRISQRLKIAPPVEGIAGKMQVIAFLGATGVGKTTTLTKLAARLSLLSSFSVGVITIDTHRIAAAKQLEIYGDILRVPVKVCYRRDEVVDALQKYAAEKKSFVLIDTAGKSPNDALPLAEIAAMLQDMATLTRVLCVPATLSAANVDHMISRFHALLSPDTLVLTKVDEAVDDLFLGHLLSTQAKFGAPLQYITNGQRVPDDLAIPDPHVIADKILPQSAL